MIDQRVLPHTERTTEFHTYQATTLAIRDMVTRGAGSVGAAAAFATAQAALSVDAGQFWNAMREATEHIKGARPTAQNLFYAVDRVVTAMHAAPDVTAARQCAVREAQQLFEDEATMALAIANAGQPLLPTDHAILTHCNTGWLALAGWGTALGILHVAQQHGRSLFVYATETRPRSQGAKLTAWELKEAGIPHALIADTAAGHYMAQGAIGMVVVGADRIAANGDTANKIGTYQLAVLARHHGIPFYVAAPSSTFDGRCPSGAQIPIEERSEAEVLEVTGTTVTRIAPDGVRAKNPAFDVTPAQLITGFVTEQGIIEPTEAAIAQLLSKNRTGSIF